MGDGYKIKYSDKQKAIAVANLSQLTYFVSTWKDTCDATVTLPADFAQRSRIVDSLEVLGIDVGVTNDIRLTHTQEGEYSPDRKIPPLREVLTTKEPLSITIREDFLQTLMDAGVSTPTLDALSGKAASRRVAKF